MNPRNIRTVFTRELMAYFNSPIAYIFIIVFVVLTAGLYMSNFFLIGLADMRYFFGLLPYILCVFIPAISMRLWADDKKGNTFELLLTFPVRPQELVLGKYLAGVAFYLAALAGTVLIPVVILLSGKPDMGPIIGGYFGAALLGGFFLSIGIFVSGLCREQIVAFIVSMMVCFVFFLSGVDFMATLIDGWVPGLGSFLRQHFGVTRHMNGFEKGVIDLRDVLYFFIMSGLFLLLNIFSIEDRLKPKAKVLFSAAAAVALASSVLINVLLSDITLGRFDLTEGRIYTVNQTTKHILRSLKAPVQATLYISPASKMPTAFKTLEQDITDRLDEMRVLAGGNFNYRVVYMEATPQEPENGQEQSAEAVLEQKGIQPFQVQSIEQDEMGVKLIYSSLSLAYKEREEEIIPTVVTQSLPNLEYDIISRIFRMTLEHQPQIALIAPYQDKQVDPQMRALMQQLGRQMGPEYRDDQFSTLEGLLRYEDYAVSRIRLSADEPIPPETTTVIVADPESLSDRQRYELSRFLSQGGKVIVAAQQYEYGYRAAGRGGVEVTPRRKQLGLSAWLPEYGVALNEKLLMDEENTVLSIAGGMSVGPFSVSVPVKAPNQILLNQEYMNQDISITSRLSSVLYLWGSALSLDQKKITADNLKLTTLLTSSDRSWLVPFTNSALKPADVEPPAGGYNGKQPLAVMLEGTFPFPYDGKPVPGWEPGDSAESGQTAPEISSRPGTLIVIGCSTMFEDDFIRKGGMANLMLNAVDVLSLGGELINIRSRQAIDRSIHSLTKGKKAWYRFLATVLVPLLVIILGVFRTILRRKEKELYLASLSR